MIVCFYGHKGGAGRSAATANIAPILSNAGYRVIVVDFDLEAPGVHRFFGVRDDACEAGVIDLVEAHAARLAGHGDAALPPFPDELLLEPRFEDVATLDGKLDAEQVRDRILGPRRIGTTTTYETGVRILPAGRLDARYRERVSAIDWSTRWRDPAWRAFFGWLKVELEARAEVVFLDARAGVTDLAALCLFGLADRVVILTPPTSQGFDGAVATARALRAAGRGPGDHGTLLVPSRVSKDADREHYGKWLHTAKQVVREPALLPLWTETRGRSQPERAAEEMLERFLLPELPVHAVGEPLVALRMLERGVQQDDLQDRYALLGGTIQRWVADNRREAAALEGLKKVEEVQARVEAARAERRFEELPALYGRLAEVKLETMTTWDHAREAAEFARRGAETAASFGDEATELRLRVLEGKALLKADDPVGAERVLEAAAGRVRGREAYTSLSIAAHGDWSVALERQEKDEEARAVVLALQEDTRGRGTEEEEHQRSLGIEIATGGAGQLDALRMAWENTPDRGLRVDVGLMLANAVGGAEAASLVERCIALAMSPPRDPARLAAAQSARFLHSGASTAQEWTRVINSFSEATPPNGNLPLAYTHRALRLRDAELAGADIDRAIGLLRSAPHTDARPFAMTVLGWIQLRVGKAVREAETLGLLADLRGMVEDGRARRILTQQAGVAAHLLFAETWPSAERAATLARNLDASMRARPWVAGRGGWRPELVAFGPLVGMVAERGEGESSARLDTAGRVLKAVAGCPETVSLVAWVQRVYLTPADRRTLLTRALALPDACPEFKAAIQAQLDAIAK